MTRLPGFVRDVWRHPVAGLVLKGFLAYIVVMELIVQMAFGRLDLPWVDGLAIGPRAAPIPRAIYFQGFVVGTLYAFVGMGLILVYRANRVINFAQAQLGSVPAVVALLLVVRQGWSYWAVVPIVLLGGALLGGGVEFALVRRFRDASRVVLTVVTIGIGFLLLVLEFFTKLAITGDLLFIDRFPTPFDGFQFSLGILQFRGDHIAAIVVGVALLLGLTAFFRRSDMGIAVRGVAENRDLASLLGVPVRRVGTIVWALAGVLSAVAVFLRAPLVGIPLTGFVGPIFLIFGLAAAVIARMEHLPTALVAGILIGMLDQTAVFLTTNSSLSMAAMTLVIIGALLVQHGREGRAHDTGISTWETVSTVRPIPAELRSLPEVVWGRRAVATLVAVLALAAPWIVGTSRATFLSQTAIFAIVGVSLVVLTGWAGQISIGQFAFSGIGAAVAGGLAANHGMDFFLTLIVAGLVGALVAVVIGLPALRIQGLFLAVTTLAFAFTVEQFVLRREYFDWLLPDSLGLAGLPVLYGRIDLNTSSEMLGVTVTGRTKFYFLTLVLLLLVMGMAQSLRRYRSGRVLIGLRDNERLVQAYGISPAATRLSAFALSGFFAALAGALLAYSNGAVDAATYSPEASIRLFAMAVIGGIGSLAGAVLGAVFLVVVPQLPVLRDIQLIELLSSGLGVLLVLLFLPGGLAEGVRRLRDQALRVIADRRGIVVPSLVADIRDPDADEVQQDVEELLRDASTGSLRSPSPSEDRVDAATLDPALAVADSQGDA